MSERVAVGSCRCTGAPHPEDWVELTAEATFPMGTAFHAAVQEAAGDSVVLQGIWSEVFLRFGIERWSFVDDEGLSIDVTLAEAKRLLAQAGYPDGTGFPSFTYMFNAGGGGGSRTHEQIGVEFQSMLREHLVLQMELRPVEWKTYLSEMSLLNYDIIRGSWIGDYQDPTTFLDCFLGDSGNNRTGWRNPTYDGLLDQAAATPDPKKRFELLRQAETLLTLDEVPIIPVYNYTGLYAFDPQRVGGIHTNLTDEHPIWAMYRKR